MIVTNCFAKRYFKGRFSIAAFVLALSLIKYIRLSKRDFFTEHKGINPNSFLRSEQACGISFVNKLFFYSWAFTENAQAIERGDLLSELQIMKKLKPHPHVIKLLGCVTLTGKIA